jgi:hypothetical protein
MDVVNTWTPKYHLDQRKFNGVYFQANGTIALNQYSKPSTEQEKQDFGYRHLISRTNEETHGLFVCWKPDITSPGIDISSKESYLYRRFNFFGKKILCHNFTWQYFHPNEIKPDGYDLSHLCCDSECCRPSHIHCELRKYQRTRDKCSGYIWYQMIGNSQTEDKTEVENRYFDVCKHTPKCKKCQFISVDEEIINVSNMEINLE